MGSYVGHNADWSDRSEDFESFCDTFILLPTLIGLFICLARFVDQVVSQKSQICAAEMRVTQLSRLRLGQVVGIMATIVMASCAIFTVPKHIQVTYPVVANYERTRHAVQSPVLNSFNRELWLNGIMQLQVPFHINDATIERKIALNVSYMVKTDDGAVDTLSLTQFTKQLSVVCHTQSAEAVEAIVSAPTENVTTLDDYEEHYFDEEQPSWALNSPSYTNSEIEALLGELEDDAEEEDQQRVKRDSGERLLFDEEEKMPRKFASDSISVVEKKRTLNCEPVPILHLDKITTHQFYLELSAELFPNEDGDDDDEVITVTSFEFVAFNPVYSQIIIWTRFVCLMISFAVTCVYANALRQLYFDDWTLEQKWTAALALSLLFLNNPTFPLQFLVRCWWVSYADQLL